MDKHQDHDPSPIKWIEWMGAVAVGIAALVAYAFTNFATKAEADGLDRKIVSTQTFIEGRLDRIERKVDSLIDRRH